ncbi:hypothetical protein DNTS_009797 [Danionella cerebrum]|uniref:Anaphase-promoting complex subunit 4-like WD40 domain-containing protein n=1 Tax=Danionella cerebrum TaxID=2873325 RepID=A0A553QGL3_9TELE|nr:hypothetical protein DNTS_009797 [Danionella translucida]
MSRVWTGGHANPLLCAAVSCESHHMVVTGAERGELTLWDHEGLPVSSLRLNSDNDVTCVSFSPLTPWKLYAAHGCSIGILDSRNPNEVVSELVDVGEEEINCLSVNESGSLIAAADDSGAVRVVDMQTEKVIRTLRMHQNICSSVSFRPHRPQSLVSLCNLPKVRPLWTCNLQDTEDSQPQKPGQMFNPPLAHCIDVASCGNLFACSAEDGFIHLLKVSEDSRLRDRAVFKAHSKGATQARFLNVLSQPNWLATGGNDGLVAIWDLSGNALVSNETKSKGQRKRTKAKARKRAEAKGICEGNQKLKEEEEDSLASCSETCGKNEPKWSVQHGEKLNWLCPAVLKGKPSLLVVDQSPNLTVYSMDEF